eukprot:s1542_g6.t1
MQPIDKNLGINLNTNEGKVLAVHALLLMVAWQCVFWSLFNENCNYAHRMDELIKLRDAERAMVNYTIDMCLEQADQDRLFLAENPEKSRIWDERKVQELSDHPDTKNTVCEAGAYGTEDLDGFPIIKRHRWLTNSNDIADELQGAEAIHKGHRGQEHRPDKDVFYVRPSRDEAAWNNILDELEKRFENTNKKRYNLSPNDEIYQAVATLVPWEIVKMQVAWCPQARRWPTDVPLSHRGAALRTTTGQLVIESEDLVSTANPKQRYTQGMRLGIFIFGNAPDDAEDDKPDAGPSETSSSAPLPGFKTEIWFENASPNLTSSMKSSLARLHLNMGHATREELVRILAASSNLTSNVLAGLDALRCGSCIRMKQPRPPPTSSCSTAASQTGFFVEHLKSDIVYIRLLTGEAVPEWLESCAPSPTTIVQKCCQIDQLPTC